MKTAKGITRSNLLDSPAVKAVVKTPGRAHVAQQPIRRDPQLHSSDLCFIRLKEVLTICGKSRSSVYDSIKNGVFPAPVKVGGRSSAWIKSEIMQWAQDCIDSSRLDI